MDFCLAAEHTQTVHTLRQVAVACSQQGRARGGGPLATDGAPVRPELLAVRRRVAPTLLPDRRRTGQESSAANVLLQKQALPPGGVTVASAHGTEESEWAMGLRRRRQHRHEDGARTGNEADLGVDNVGHGARR